ncbi:PIN domain-containing protein [Candidatus Neptunochlamydia vexilliferae]|uniref:PIN domain-containing protein n=1 Tax=Candidatus Neptunichlamydia vexilliferae TaxID=1651774 RepID=A0ABS0AXE9_9BACT|nr:PIN domain-containing protein [Candidatus Neptunochlamydia vexilliferae]MBF5058798.1 hypothetical protein [Candidatus Neptunochlamydia vexilliferae]
MEHEASRKKINQDILILRVDRALDWVEQALDIPGIQLSTITPKIAIQSTKLLGEVHGDPLDRLLIATAFEENAVLVTKDQKILKYAKGKFISAYNPCCSSK